MNSSKCNNCGLVNSQGEPTCRRCGRALTTVRNTTRIERETSIVAAVPEYGRRPDQYEPPRSPFGGTFADAGGVWRDGATLIMNKSARLPDYCIKCGDAANGSHLTRNLSWHHPALGLLVFAGFLVYAVVALIVRKSAMIEISLCPDHIRRYWTRVAMTWLGFLVGIVFIALAISKESGGSAIFGILLALASAIYGAIFAKAVSVKKIDDHFVWLRGIDARFLALLPSVNTQ